MAHRLLALGVLFAIVVGVATAIEPDTMADEKEKATVERIGLRINQHVVFAGQTVQLRSVVDREDDIHVGTVSFAVKRIGFFHRGLGKIVFSDDAIDTLVLPEEAFTGLSTHQGSHGISWTHVTPVEKGFESQLVAKKYGAFLITCSWRIRGDAAKQIHSNPVLLQVVPRTNPLNGAPEIEKSRLWNEGIDGEQDFEALYDQARAKWDTVE